jgi:hypothetical protein
VVVAAVAGAACADVLNFDDLVGQGSMPNGYGGIADWNGWQYYDAVQPPYNPSSPPTRIYNISNGNIGFGADYIFDGAFFNGHGSGDGFLPIFFQLYQDGSLVHTSDSIALDGSGNGIFLNSGYNGLVDQVVVNGSHGFYILDDLTYRIPAPGALAALGVGGLMAARRRR